MKLLYQSGFVKKSEKYLDPKDGKEKRRSLISKNEIAQNQIGYAIKNKAKFRFVLFDAWFSSVENMKFSLAKDFYVSNLSIVNGKAPVFFRNLAIGVKFYNSNCIRRRTYYLAACRKRTAN